MNEDCDATVKTLLANVSKCLKAINESSSNREDFNVFRLCRVNHYENAHSRIMAEFLNPQGSHGFGDAFLSKFYEIAGLDKRIGSPRIDTERWTGRLSGKEYERRMDIVIEDNINDQDDVRRNQSPCKRLTVIENKILAGEQTDQLCDYYDWMCQSAHGVKDLRELVFLTLDGRESETCNGKPTVRISYAKTICAWLDACIKIAAEQPIVRETLRQYRNLIIKLIPTERDVQPMNEITTKCTETPELFEAALVIANNASRIRSAAANAVVKRLYDYVSGPSCADLPIVPVGNASNISYDGTYQGFGFSIKDSPCLIWFEFQKSHFRDLWAGLAWTDDLRNNSGKLSMWMKEASDIGWPPNGAWAVGKYCATRSWDDDVLKNALGDDTRGQSIVDSLVSEVRRLCCEAQRLKIVNLGGKEDAMSYCKEKSEDRQ